MFVNLRVVDGSISIHALLAESDADGGPIMQLYIGTFLSTLSLRRATVVTRGNDNVNIISIHALLAESDEQESIPEEVETYISIHALLAESDSLNINGPLKAGHFYPRSPCGERRRRSVKLFHQNYHFYPRSPCGERLA